MSEQHDRLEEELQAFRTALATVADEDALYGLQVRFLASANPDRGKHKTSTIWFYNDVLNYMSSALPVIILLSSKLFKKSNLFSCK